MSDLETLIRDLAKRGELNHIGLSADMNGKVFVASYRDTTGHHTVQYAENRDPVEAIKAAIDKASRLRRGQKSAAKAAKQAAKEDDLI